MLTPFNHARRKLLSPRFSLLIASTPRPPSNHQRCHSTNTTTPSPSISSCPTPSSSSSQPQVIFSGIQPTGTPHLGNYLGALSTWVKLQSTSPPGTKLLFSIVDLHAITLPKNPQELREWKRECLRCLLALGLGEEGKSTVFMQSQVPAHAELMWILSCTASMGYLSRMTQWKSKLSLSDDASPVEESSKSKLKLGLFSYPVLQAADILIHRATHVPVGEDQSQHLEFARECVTNFNHAYGPVLIHPQTLLSPAKRIMSLTSPTQKMSKSNPNPASRILITDPPSHIHRKLMSAVTDSQNSVSWDPVNRPGVSNLLTLLSYFDSEGGGRSAEELGRLYEGKGVGLGAFKNLVAEAISEGLSGVRRRYEEVKREGDEYIESVERRGAVDAGESAEATMVRVREAVGL